MNSMEREAAKMFGDYIRDIIEQEAAGGAIEMARGIADIFERNPRAGPWKTFDKAEFLRIALAD